MNFSVELIKNSVSSEYPHVRLTTYKLRYPRIIHAEFMTHRVLSRNASSSRAIPVGKMMSWSSEDMFVPLFRQNQPGMQPGEYLSVEDQIRAETIWKLQAEHCLASARELSKLNVHKQWANRMLEWFGYINVVVTGTDWANFFALRTEVNEHGFPVPQDEIYELAKEMERQYHMADADYIRPGEWHLPFITDDDINATDNAYDLLQKISVARCARVSYLTVDGKVPTINEDLKLYDRLLGKHPIHASPAEHQGTPDKTNADTYVDWTWKKPELHGNFNGWIQYRKLLDGENITG